MIEGGRVDVGGSVVMTPVSQGANPMKALRTAKDVREAFSGYENTEVGCAAIYFALLRLSVPSWTIACVAG